MQLFTVQMARWRQLKERNIELIDTTVKSGERAFCPTWEMVLGHKEGRISDEGYTSMYLDMMRHSYMEQRGTWDRLLLITAPVAIACYCSSQPGTFCHRHLLKNILERICESRGIAFQYFGEFT